MIFQYDPMLHFCYYCSCIPYKFMAMCERIRTPYSLSGAADMCCVMQLSRLLALFVCVHGCMHEWRVGGRIHWQTTQSAIITYVCGIRVTSKSSTYRKKEWGCIHCDVIQHHDTRFVASITMHVAMSMHAWRSTYACMHSCTKTTHTVATAVYKLNKEKETSELFN